MRLGSSGEPGPPADLPAATAQGPAGLGRESCIAEVGLLAFGVPGAVAAAVDAFSELSRSSKSGVAMALVMMGGAW